MTPDAVIDELKKVFDIIISRPTLLRYEHLGLISKPERGGTGGKGRFTNYPNVVVAEAYASWKMIHGEYGNEADREPFGGKMPKLSPEFASLIAKVDEDSRFANSEKVIKSSRGKLLGQTNEDTVEGNQIMDVSKWIKVFEPYWIKAKTEALEKMRTLG